MARLRHPPSDRRRRIPDIADDDMPVVGQWREAAQIADRVETLARSQSGEKGVVSGRCTMEIGRHACSLRILRHHHQIGFLQGAPHACTLPAES
jgi:hypothetical protein